MAHPVDRRGRALGLVLVGAGEEGGVPGEAELEEVEAVAEPDQVGAELIWGDLDRRPSQEGVDGAHEVLERAAVLALAITHPCRCRTNVCSGGGRPYPRSCCGTRVSTMS